MSHFAKVEDGIVTEVIVADQKTIDAMPDAHKWVQTSYRTYGGQHPEGRPLRMNFAGAGYTYDAERDAFYGPQPAPECWFDETTCLWVCPDQEETP
jgi:hypothetical protein